jgi:carbon monoxide dehydrogenase subunit G
MALKIAVSVLVVIAAILVFAATKPNVVRVRRSLSIQAPPDKIFALINDFHNWSRWAPQDKDDPTMKRTYSGPGNGVGAISYWDSTGSAGKGRMEIMESLAPRKISINVDFLKPFAAHNINEFDLEPDGTSTKVTWSMQGTNVYLMKLMGIFVNIDRVMGKHFETGLDNLNAAVQQ